MMNGLRSWFISIGGHGIDLQLGILASLATAGIVAIVNRFRQLLNKRSRIRKFFGKSSQNFMLFTGQIYFNPSNHRYMAAGDIKSVLCLTLNIHSIFKLKKIPHKFSDEAVISQDLRENIITIGGPKFNTVTRVMIDKYNQMIPSFPAKFNGNSIYINAVNARGETFQKQFCLKRHNGTLIDDYGLLIRGINPFDDTNSSLSWVIAGSGSNGVIASVDQMSHFIHGFQVRFRRLYKFLYSGAIGIVVVKANFFEGEYVSSNPVFYAVYKPSNRPFLKKKFNWEFRNLDI